MKVRELLGILTNLPPELLDTSVIIVVRPISDECRIDSWISQDLRVITTYTLTGKVTTVEITT